jgi:glycosyltransferase involved in cell wall biosynthesis
MRILVAHNCYKEPGGEDEVFRNEVALLRKAGFDVDEYLEDNHKIDEMSPVTLGFNTIWSRSTKLNLRQNLQKCRPDVVHFHNTFPLISPSAYAACAEMGTSVVQTLHNYRMLCPGATLFRDGKVCEDCLVKTVKWPAISHRCYRRSYLGSSVAATMLAVHSFLKTWETRVHKFIALTEFSRAKFIEGGLSASKINVKPNFTSLDPETTSREGEYALYVGRIVPEKGLRILLEAWKKLAVSIPLKSAGDGPMRKDLESEIVRLNLQNVHLLGRLPKSDIVKAMQEARFLIFPSLWFEGFPMTLVEAFATRLPVIASRLGSIAEIVQDGVTGLLFEPGNPIDLAEKVTWAWCHSAELNDMAVPARLEYESKYTPARNLDLLTSIYKDAIASNSLSGNRVK